MVGDLRDHRDVRSGARQNGLVHPLHVVRHERRQRLDQAIGRPFSQRNDNTHEMLSLARPRHSTIKTPKRRGKCAPRGSPLVEILRTNDLVLISVIESLLEGGGRRFLCRRPAHGRGRRIARIPAEADSGRGARGSAGAPAPDRGRPRRRTAPWLSRPSGCGDGSPDALSSDAWLGGRLILVQPGAATGPAPTPPCSPRRRISPTAGSPTSAPASARSPSLSSAAAARHSATWSRSTPISRTSPPATRHATDWPSARGSSSLDVCDARARREAGLADEAGRRGRHQSAVLRPRDGSRSRPMPARARAHVFGGEAGGAPLVAWIRACLAILEPGGRFVMIHRPDALAAILTAAENRLGALALLPVHPRAGASAHRLLVSGVKGSRAPLRIARGLVLHEADGRLTARSGRDPPRRGADRLASEALSVRAPGRARPSAAH